MIIKYLAFSNGHGYDALLLTIARLHIRNCFAIQINEYRLQNNANQLVTNRIYDGNSLALMDSIFLLEGH